jgi:hypothetical protein
MVYYCAIVHFLDRDGTTLEQLKIWQICTWIVRRYWLLRDLLRVPTIRRVWLLKSNIGSTRLNRVWIRHLIHFNFRDLRLMMLLLYLMILYMLVIICKIKYRSWLIHQLWLNGSIEHYLLRGVNNLRLLYSHRLIHWRVVQDCCRREATWCQWFRLLFWRMHFTLRNWRKNLRMLVNYFLLGLVVLKYVNRVFMFSHLLKDLFLL